MRSTGEENITAWGVFSLPPKTKLRIPLWW